eukprot:379191-Pleurochrysis_carterae.AAC.2
MDDSLGRHPQGPLSAFAWAYRGAPYQFWTLPTNPIRIRPRFWFPRSPQILLSAFMADPVLLALRRHAFK